MASSTQSRNVVQAGARWKGRLLAVAAAVVAAVVVYLLINLFVQDPRTPGMSGRSAADLTFGAVLLVSALASLAGWGLLAVLEKLTAKPRQIWTIVAAVALLLSLGGPMSGSGISTGNRLALALLHVVVGTVLIVLMRRTTGRTESRAT
jgi:hypothetical protein